MRSLLNVYTVSGGRNKLIKSFTQLACAAVITSQTFDFSMYHKMFSV